MSDAELMDADCIHGVTWWECDECPQFGDEEPENVEELMNDPDRTVNATGGGS